MLLLQTASEFRDYRHGSRYHLALSFRRRGDSHRHQGHGGVRRRKASLPGYQQAPRQLTLSRLPVQAHQGHHPLPSLHRQEQPLARHSLPGARLNEGGYPARRPATLARVRSCWTRAAACSIIPREPHHLASTFPCLSFLFIRSLPLSHRSAPVKISDIGRNHVRVQKTPEEERLVKIDAVLEGPTIFIRLDPEDGAWPFLLRNDSDYPITFSQAVSALFGLPYRRSTLTCFVVAARGHASGSQEASQAVQDRRPHQASLRLGRSCRQQQAIADHCWRQRAHHQRPRNWSADTL